MKKIICLLAIFLFLEGCVHNVKIPGPLNKGTWYQLTSDDFQILGTVEAEGEIKNILFLYTWGGEGASAIADKVKAMGGDDFINFHSDLEGFGVLFFVYNTWKWKARATVIKYRDKVKK
jgi:hypothetical protein